MSGIETLTLDRKPTQQVKQTSVAKRLVKRLDCPQSQESPHCCPQSAPIETRVREIDDLFGKSKAVTDKCDCFITFSFHIFTGACVMISSSSNEEEKKRLQQQSELIRFP